MIRNYENSGLDPGDLNKHKRPLKTAAFGDNSLHSKKTWIQTYSNFDLNSDLII